MKKFELTSETKVVHGRTLHRIRALLSFGEVEAGDLGGWIEKEENLDHFGNAWVYDDACVFDDAYACGNAQIYGNAQVSDNAWVGGNAQVFNNALVSGVARIYDNAHVFDDAYVYGNAEVYGDAWVCSNALVFGNAQLYGDALAGRDAEIFGFDAIFWISTGPKNNTATFFACRDGKIRVVIGCFYGELEEFKLKIKKRHGDNMHAKFYQLAIEMAKERIIIPNSIKEGA